MIFIKVRKPKFKNLSKNKASDFKYDDEIFLDIDDTVVDGIFDYYQISNYGRVFHKYLGIFLSPGVNGGGYKFIEVATKYGPRAIQIHRAEKIMFEPIDGFELLEVNHDDGNKFNNRLSNLLWSTKSENVQHAYDTGLHHVGEDNVHSTITNNTARNICDRLAENKYTINEIAEMYGISNSIVASIKKKESWLSISADYEFESRPGRLFNEEQINNICSYFERCPIMRGTINDQCRDALEYFGYDSSDRYVETVRKIYTRKYYTNISKKYKF